MSQTESKPEETEAVKQGEKSPEPPQKKKRPVRSCPRCGSTIHFSTAACTLPKKPGEISSPS